MNSPSYLRANCRSFSVLLSMLMTLTFSVPLLRADDSVTYEQKIAAAQAFATAGSWDEAYLAFAAARPLSSNEETRRWSDFWVRNAAWHSRHYDRVAGVGLQTMAEYFAAQFQPYEQGRPRDEFWLNLKSCRAEFIPQQEYSQGVTYFHGFSHWDTSSEKTETRVSWNDLLDMADYLSALPVTPENTRRYVGCLQRIVHHLGIVTLSSAGDRMRTHLAKACALKAAADDAAWCLLAHARTMCEDARLPLAQRDQYWWQALQAADGTLWQNKIRAAYAIWQVRRINDHEQPPLDRKSRAEALAELKAFAPTTPHDEGEIFHKDYYTISQIVSALSQPTLKISIAPMAAPGQPVVMNYAAANLVSVHATLSRLPIPSAPEKFTKAAPIVIRDWALALLDNRPGAWNTATVEVAPQLPPGVYELSLAGTADPSTTPPAQPLNESVVFTVSDLTATVFTSSAGSSEVFVSRRSTGKPVSHAPVHGLTGFRDTPPKSSELRTDSDGRVVIPASGHTGHNLVSEDEEVVLAIEGEPLHFDRPLPLSAPGLQFEIFTDKQSYQPGEVVSWHILALNFRADRFLPPDFPVFLTAYLNGEALFKNEPLSFNLSSLTQGRFTVPAQAKPGDLMLFISRNPEIAERELVWQMADLKVVNAPPPAPLAQQDARSIRTDLSERRAPATVSPRLHPLNKNWLESVTITDGTGAPATFAGEARLYEIRWDEAWTDPAGKIVTGSGLRKFPELRTNESDMGILGWRQLRNNEVHTLVATHPAKSGRDGKVTTKFKLPHAGLFQVQYWRDGQPLPGGDGPAVVALAPDRPALEQYPAASFIFGPDSLETGKPFTATIILPQGETECWLSLLGDQEVITRKIIASDRIARVTFDRAPHMNALGSLTLFSVPVAKDPFCNLDIPVKNAQLPAPVIELNRQLQELPAKIRLGFYPYWYTQPRVPSEDPEDDSYNDSIAGTRLSVRYPYFEAHQTLRFQNPRPEFRPWIASFDYLNAMGCRCDVPQLKAKSVQALDANRPPSLFPDERIKPVLVGEKYGYCPETVAYTGLTPF